MSSEHRRRKRGPPAAALQITPDPQSLLLREPKSRAAHVQSRPRCRSRAHALYARCRELAFSEHGEKFPNVYLHFAQKQENEQAIGNLKTPKAILPFLQQQKIKSRGRIYSLVCSGSGSSLSTKRKNV